MKRLIFLFAALTATLSAQVKDDTSLLIKSYTIQQLVTLSDSGGVLLPARINEIDTHFIIHSSFEGILLDSKFAEQNKIKGAPTRAQLNYELELKEKPNVHFARIDNLSVGTGAAFNLLRGKRTLIAETNLPVAAKFKNLTLPIAGFAGLEMVEEIKPIIDFGNSRLLLPHKGTSVGLYSEIVTQNGYEPVIMVRERKTGAYYVVVKFKRKDYGFLVDLNQTGSTIDGRMLRQMGLKDVDGKVRATTGSLGLTPIDDFTFQKADIENSGRNILGYRYAGRVGVDFFKKFNVAVDFAGPLAVVPIPLEVER